MMEEIREQEDRRCRAVVAGDLATLGDLLADDLVHIHISGLVDSKESYLDSLQSKYRFHDMKRIDLAVKPRGDVAVATGLLSLSMSFDGEDVRHDAKLVTTQVWVNSSGTWRQSNYHASRID